MQPEITKLLFDIRLAITLLEDFVCDKTLNNYLEEPLLRSGVERQFEIIGEALNQAISKQSSLTNSIRNSRRIIDFRNLLIHGYAIVSDEVVWGIIQKYLPELKEDLDRIFPEEIHGN